MGADTFLITAAGDTAQEAFRAAVTAAKRRHGNRYTGSIAEKSRFIICLPPKGVEPESYAQKLLDRHVDIHAQLVGDEAVLMKYGPCGAVRSAPGKWIFFGWASD